jgi:aminopeptidase N
MIKNFILGVLLLLAVESFGQEAYDCYHFDEGGRTREHFVDFQTMTLDISFDVNAKMVYGNVEYVFSTIRPVINSLALDAPEIAIESVLLDDEPVTFEMIDDQVHIQFPKNLPWEEVYALNIAYTAQPEKGIYFLGWDDASDRMRKQIWTQGQGVDNRYWIPSFDDVSDKLITETRITFDTAFEVISNGNLREINDNKDGTQTWHYKMDEPHVPYLVMIAIGDFDYVDMTSSNGIVSRQYYYPDRPQEIEPTYAYSNEMMDWMEEEFGLDYPWGKIYRNVPVADFLYGAMENTTSTIFTDYYLQDSREALERNYVGTNAHELTHQWFGDLISEWNGASHWLHESFATHYAKHFEREVYGEDAFQWERYKEMQRAMYADDKDNLPIAHSESGSSRHYPKGSFVIDMLREAAGGDEAYRKVMTSYLKKYAFKHVDTHLYQLEFLNVLGLNLDWFFNQWVYKGGYPVLECSFKESKEELLLRVNQVQKQSSTVGLFQLDLPIQVHYKDGSHTNLVMKVREAEEEFLVKNESKKTVDFVVFNPNNALYAEIKQDRSTEELLAQVLKAPFMMDRYLALLALEDVAIKEKRKTLLAAYENETFYALKANIVKQLANDSSQESKALIMNAAQDELVEVRRAVLMHRDSVDERLFPFIEDMLSDSSIVNVELALEKLVAQYPEKKEAFYEAVANDAAAYDQLNVALLNLKAADGDKNAMLQLVDYCSGSFEFRLRIKAMKALEELNYSGEDFLLQLIETSVHFNRRLAGTASGILTSIVSEMDDSSPIVELIARFDFDKNELKRLDVLREKLGFRD